MSANQHRAAGRSARIACVVVACSLFYVVACNQIAATSTETDKVAIALKAGPNGDLTAIQIQRNEPITGSDMLEQLIQMMERAAQIAHDAGQSEPEYRLLIDDNLRFREVGSVLETVYRFNPSVENSPRPTTVVRLQTENLQVGIGKPYLNYRIARGAERIRIGFDSPATIPDGLSNRK